MNASFTETGVHLAHQVFDWQEAQRLRAAIAPHMLIGARDPFNPVAVPMPATLQLVCAAPKMLELMHELVGFVGVYEQRLVVKDAHFRGPVFLHQDCCYHKGGFKYSAFVALSPVTAENGGLTVYPGTFRFGYLGDAGEIDRALLAQVGAEPYTPTMQPGDVLVMHSATWHESGPHCDGPDRVLLDIIYGSADDPFCNGMAPSLLRTAPHVRSRVARIRELQAQLVAVESGDARPRGAQPADASHAADGSGRGGDRQGARLVPASGQADRPGSNAHGVGEHRGVPAKVRP